MLAVPKYKMALVTLSGPAGSRPNAASLGFKENLLFNPVCSHWNPENSRDPTKLSQWSPQGQGRVTNKMGSKRPASLHPDQLSLICPACLLFPYDFTEGIALCFCVQATA